MSNHEQEVECPGLGLFFGVIEHNKRPEIIWSGSTWHSELQTWDLLLKILVTKDKATLEEVGWNFLPIIWDDIEIFALTKLFQIPAKGSAYLVLYHQSPEILTTFLLQKEEELNNTFQEILDSYFMTHTLSNEQLKQIRIKCQKYYVFLSEIKLS